MSRSRSVRRPAVAIAAALLILGTLAVPGLANLGGSPFDAGDGNLILNDEAQDWANAPSLQKGIDKPTGTQDDSFGQGTKEDTAVPTVVSGSIPPNKSDLTRFYVANDKVGGKDYLYLAWERVQEPNGTTNMDFEFNQDATVSSNGVTPIRTAGDVLIKYDLSQGGTRPTLGYHLWVTSGTPSQVCEASNTVPCWGKVQPLSGANFEGAINDPSNNPPTGEVVDPIAPNAPRTLSPRTFGEAAINLTDSGILPSGTCKAFGAAYLKSRSSDSFTAAVKDFIAPIPVNITNCGTVNIHKTDDASPANALQGAVFTLYTNVAPLTAPRGAGDVATSFTCTTDATGDCSMSSVPFGNYWAVETTGVSGYDLAPDQAFSLTSSTPNLTISLTFVDPRQKGAIIVVKNAKNKNCSDTVPPDGCVNGNAPLAGAGFEIWQESNSVAGLQTGQGGDTKVANQQLTALSGSGSSTIASTCFAGLFFGSYYVHESAAPSGYAAAADQTATITVKSDCTDTTVIKTFTDIPLTDLAVSATAQVPGTTESSITCTRASNGSHIGNSPVDFTDPASLQANGLRPGTYNCTVVIDP